MSLGFVLVIHRAKNGRKIYVVVGYENAETYKQYKYKLVRKSIGTQKGGCPFKLKGKFVK